MTDVETAPRSLTARTFLLGDATGTDTADRLAQELASGR